MLAVAIAFIAALPGTALRAQGPALSPYNAAIADSSISGLSSGAFMAVQFGFAWSSVIKGIGVIAGGPFYCAQASAADVFNGYTFPIATATGPCMAGPPPSLGPLTAKLETKVAAGAIDPLDNVKAQKIYLFHGYNDAVVARTVTDAAAEFYRHHLGEAARGNLFYQYTRGAGHSLVVKDETAGDINACPANQTPFIDQCGYDQAGIILQHIYGALRPGTLGQLSGSVKSFDQNRYTGRHIADALSLGNEGYVFVPNECEQGVPCRVHVVLHGCEQGVGTIGRLFIERTGYNAWADANRIIVLYPQAKTSPYLPYNPKGCWDWWSYVDHSDDYVTKAGPQIAAIKAMLDALTARGGSPPAPMSNEDTPSELIVTDTSDVAAALAWTPVAGASGYRIWRADADGVFRAVGETSGPSYGDQGLAPATSYAWQVAAVIGGSERSPSPRARATTRPTPSPCATPGTCS
jgi:poly(3-hydroxybutyrate) depolymerase